MARIVKDAEARKDEILDAAEALFQEKGFDGASTGDILERVGIARGTLYYHFKSKEDIMDALIERHTARITEAARSVAADTSIPADMRVLRAVMALKVRGGSEEALIEHIHKPQNALMHRKIQKAMLMRVTPILAGIVEEGISQGIFNTPFPYECVEMIVAYADTIFDDDMVELTEEGQAGRARAIIYNAERLFGVAEGGLIHIAPIFGGNDNDSDNNDGTHE